MFSKYQDHYIWGEMPDPSAHTSRFAKQILKKNITKKFPYKKALKETEM